jgi:type II protein arginine methyltransferase
MPLRDPIGLNEVPASFRPFAGALLAQNDPEPGLIRLLGTLGSKAPRTEARDFALLLRRVLPRSARLDRVSDLFIRHDYPIWYIRAVNDRHRNAAYRRALEALVTPGTLVVEAGTGSGLFAMMAARAGAGHVFTCEIDPHVAAVARANIARNGLTGRITLFECPYGQLRVGEHLPRPADLFLHEFVASELLVPKMGAMIGELRDGILAPGAHILPNGFDTLGMLVGDEWLLDSIRVPPTVEGFDVTGINLFGSPGISLPGPVPIERRLSDVSMLAECDLASAAKPAEFSRVVAIPVIADGVATGVLQWVRHSFPDGSAYENRPELSCNWWPNFWPFQRPVPLKAGDMLNLRVDCTETEIFIDLVNPSDG